MSKHHHRPRSRRPSNPSRSCDYKTNQGNVFETERKAWDKLIISEDFAEVYKCLICGKFHLTKSTVVKRGNNGFVGRGA